MLRRDSAQGCCQGCLECCQNVKGVLRERFPPAKVGFSLCGTAWRHGGKLRNVARGCCTVGGGEAEGILQVRCEGGMCVCAL